MSGYTCFAQYYDVLSHNVGYEARAAYFDSLFRSRGGEPKLLLDLACGTGSLSLELAALGYDVIGVDGSREMLSVALSKTVSAERDILYLCQPMDRLDLYGTVDACVCALDSLNHLPNQAALARVFARVALFLNPGGIFIFDVNTAYKHREILAENTYIYDLPQVYCVWQNAYKEQDDQVDITLDFFIPRQGGGRGYDRQSECFSERIFSSPLIERLLSENKFTLLDVYGDDSLAPPRTESQRLVYLTQLDKK